MGVHVVTRTVAGTSQVDTSHVHTSYTHVHTYTYTYTHITRAHIIYTHTHTHTYTYIHTHTHSRVPLERQLAVGHLDVLGGGLARHAQHGVQVLAGGAW